MKQSDVPSPLQMFVDNAHSRGLRLAKAEANTRDKNVIKRSPEKDEPHCSNTFKPALVATSSTWISSHWNSIQNHKLEKPEPS